MSTLIKLVSRSSKKFWKVTDDKLMVYIVDAKFVRDNYSVEFTDSGSHFEFDFIPKNEIWVYRADCLDMESALYYQLAYYRSKAQDFSESKSRHNAEEAVNDFYNKIRKDVPNKNPKLKLLKIIKVHDIDVKVYLVSGGVVRVHLYPDFIEGGNWKRYKFIPKDEIWIDNVVDPSEYDKEIDHEAYEAGKMLEGEGYDKAHNDALKNDRKGRHL